MGVTFEQSEYRGYEALVFEIDTRKVILVRPNKEMGHRRLVMKTEYFDAFPDLQIEMLERGYHLTCVENRSRWGTDEDCRTKAEVVRFLHEHFSLYPRVITVGMSCGGFHAVNFASLYPELQSFLYLDAPLLSFLSYPYGMGEVARNEQVIEEITRAYGFDLPHALAYNRQPIHRLQALTDARLPVALVYGDADQRVSCRENALILKEFYEKAGAPIRTWCKPGCDHHPHGPIGFMDEVIDYIEANML